MTIASIDIGSNTVLMLLANVNINGFKIETIKNFYRAPRISKGLLENGTISQENITELLNVFEEYQKIIKDYKCDKILLVATNAFRVAKNSYEIKELIKRKFNWDINIIDGDEEARLSFIGATYDYNVKEKIVIDIGGGSTEIIYGSNSDIIIKKSFPAGIVSLSEKFIKSKIPSLKEIDDLIKELDYIFAELDSIPKNVFTIAVAGTPTTLSCINQNIKVYDEKSVDNSKISYSEIENIISELSTLSPEQVRNRYGQIVEGREDILLTGTIILKRLMNKLELKEITVSNKGLRYGVIIDYLINL